MWTRTSTPTVVSCVPFVCLLWCFVCVIFFFGSLHVTLWLKIFVFASHSIPWSSPCRMHEQVEPSLSSTSPSTSLSSSSSSLSSSTSSCPSSSWGWVVNNPAHCRRGDGVPGLQLLLNRNLKYQKYKGAVVLRGNIVKDDSGAYAVFTEQGSSASQMTAAEAMDKKIQTSRKFDAVSAYTQVELEGA